MVWREPFTTQRSEREAIVANHPSHSLGVPSGVSRVVRHEGGRWCEESGVRLRNAKTGRQGMMFVRSLRCACLTSFESVATTVYE